MHVDAELQNRTIVAIRLSPSKRYYSRVFALLWKDLSKRLKHKTKRVYTDKAYWSRNIFELLVTEGKIAVIPPKKNSVDHGSASPMVQIVRA